MKKPKKEKMDAMDAMRYFLVDKPVIKTYTAPRWLRRLFEPIRKWWEKNGCDWGSR